MTTEPAALAAMRAAKAKSITDGTSTSNAGALSPSANQTGGNDMTESSNGGGGDSGAPGVGADGKSLIGEDGSDQASKASGLLTRCRHATKPVACGITNTR